MKIFCGSSWLCYESQLDSWFCDSWRRKNPDCCNGLQSSGAGWVPLEKANRVDNKLWDWWQGSCSWKWYKNIWEHPQQRSWAFWWLKKRLVDCRLVVAMKTKKFTELEADKHNYACSQMKCWITKSTKGCLYDSVQYFDREYE